MENTAQNPQNSQNSQGQQAPQSQQAPAGAQPAQQWARQAQPQPSAQPGAQAQPGPQRYAYQPGFAQPQYAQPAYAAPAAPAPKKKSRGWIVAIVAIVCLTLLCVLGMKACSDALAPIGGLADHPLTGDTVAVVDLDGTIQYDGSACSPEGFKDLLDQAADDDHVKALVIRVNSGGGTATAGEEMAAYLRDFDKPVVVSSASINASAAYEISSQADYIYVARSTEIGAIGTAMELTDLSGLLDMLGVNMEVITSAESKDSSYGYRPLSDEERAYYQDMVDKINQMFLDNVAEGRGMAPDKVKELATGMPFTGEDAIENGLADAVGTREDAIDKAAELAGISDYDTTELYLSNYDLGGLSYLLGRTDLSVEDLAALMQSGDRVRLK